MTIEDLERICKEARQAGLDGNCVVKVFYHYNILPISDHQIRKVQQYRDDGINYRNKYLLLGVSPCSHLKPT